MRIIHYYSEDASRHPAWIAYIEMDDGTVLGVQFKGCTKDEVDARAEAFWERERNLNRDGSPARRDNQGWPSLPEVARVNPWARPRSNNYISPASSEVADKENSSEAPDGLEKGKSYKNVIGDLQKSGQISSHSLLGSVWLINREEKRRLRVSASEVASYEAAGWIRGGPKTKIE